MKHSDQALKFIRDTITTRGYPPSRREIADHLGITLQPATKVIDGLVREGLIEVDARIPRGIRVTGRTRAARMKARTEEM